MRSPTTPGPARRLVPLLVCALVAGGAAPAAAQDGGDRHGAGRPAERVARTDGQQHYVSTRPSRGAFGLVDDGRAAPVVVSAEDHSGVLRAAADLQGDVEAVTGRRPAESVLPAGQLPRDDEVVIVGTLGRSPLVDRLVAQGRLDVRGVAGRWETSVQQVVEDPLPGVERALVIAGSDPRGTIFGVYDVSREIGVSPWSFWDDVPAPHREELFVAAGRHTQGTPAVKYRGFFINDENPALGRWAPQHFGPGEAEGFPGGFNADFYGEVFETMLRLKANYLWPAVWGRAFAEDDPQNHQRAAEYGVVMGTSHEAPMMRGIEEWNRHAVPAQRDAAGDVTVPGSDPYGGTGEWSFRRNRAAIEAYWREGVQRMVDQGFEGVVTLGMRGNGDVALPDGEGIELMEEILASQRRILQEVAGGDITDIPQVQTLYKEVQRYWDEGLRPPDDVTVVYADDNWGNMRKLPDQDLPEREGGYGLYYHFDYVGQGRNYKWVDTVNTANTWEQLNAAYEHGVDRLWVVNVGDLKNQELPTQFFLDYAWNPDALPVERLAQWEAAYAAENFGREHAREIADVLHRYGVLQARRKPELLNRKITLDESKDLATDPTAVLHDDEGNPYSLNHYREMDRVTGEWARLRADAERIGARLPAEHADAYYQLVLYQVAATSNLYDLRNAQFTNLLYAQQGRAATNARADEAEARFADDQAMSKKYDTEIAGGKWNGFQTQPKIGYGDVERYGPNAPWQQPELENEALPDAIYPHLKRIEVPERAEMGVAVDGSDEWWAAGRTGAVLPTFSPHQSQPAQYLEVFNRGSQPFDYRIEPGAPYLRVDRTRGTVDDQVRATLRVDWRRAPAGRTEVPVTVTGPDGARVVVTAVLERPALPRGQVRGAVEANGYVSVRAQDFERAVGADGVSWKVVPDLGREGDGVVPWPSTAPRQTPGGTSPHLEYTVTLTQAGPVDVTAHLSPRNGVTTDGTLSYAVSVDDGAPQVVDIVSATGSDDTTMNPQWARNTSDNVNRTTTTHQVAAPGVHTVKFWMVDPMVVLQDLVLDTGGLQESYLAPPASVRVEHGRHRG
ncbi:glycosyl hydrolase 115 family protein [Kineococcus indalonis]|uniref:glycosyl hydrolase 115 family protein n=1 Tax=Kineococcus indalonis TaxID=2696566 RepID=UPI001412BC51|nr:glycosyl hydrolase 115 family protein [Kineococcus indalonis]NAZ87770.1 glycosyl hydrolase [Kineococcus indalonis]